MFKKIKAYFVQLKAKHKIRKKNRIIIKENKKKDNITIEEKFSELIKRRDEVITRATGTIPDFYLMRKDRMVFRDYLVWIIEPHIKRDFNPYRQNKDENERIAQKTVYKILKEVEKENVQEEESLPVNEETA